MLSSDVKKTALTLVALATAACGGPGGGSDDTGMGGADASTDDASAPTAGLRIQFNADPGIDEFDGDFDPELTEVAITLSDVRAIGDAAPGDETRRDLFTLTFAEGDSQSIQFAEAPIGRYSRVRARLDSFLLSGTNQVNPIVDRWEINVVPEGGIQIDVSFDAVELTPGEDASIAIRARLEKPYKEVGWSELTPDDDGVLRVDNSYDDIDEIREKIGEVLGDEEDDDDEDERRR